MTKRLERDSLGEIEISNDNYYGIQGQRAIHNFNVSGLKISFFPILIQSLAQVKKCSALANKELNALPADICDPIVFACDKVINGDFISQFKLDVIQGGAGTSVNMIMNEVLANIALESIGCDKGQYNVINPNDHVNMSQSTNDVYASSVKIAVYKYVNTLIDEIEKLSSVFKSKGNEYKDVIKVGRTQLQDALPMTVDQEFTSYSNQIISSLENIKVVRKSLLGLNLGGTAIGTCANTPSRYIPMVEKYIKSLVSEDFFTQKDLIAATQDTSCFSQFSGSLKSFALQLSKICNDLRLLSSGPRSGIGEIELPSMQAGSSIMPGKVNPVIPEMVTQSCYQVIGSDSTISFAVEAGQLELNAFLPLISFNLLNSVLILSNSIRILREKCIQGLKVNIERTEQYVKDNLSVATFLNKYIGYKKSSEIVALAMREDKSIYEVILEHKILSEQQLKEFMSVLHISN